MMGNTKGQALQYRPDEYDDWGTIKDQNGYVVCQVRTPRCSEENLSQCRLYGFDPWGISAKRFVACVNAFEGIDDPAAFMRDVREYFNGAYFMLADNDIDIFQRISNALTER